MPLRLCAALVLAACLVRACNAADTPAPVETAPARPPMTDIRAMGPVATVSGIRVGADQVFELWTPIWYETLAKVRNNKLSAAEGDKRLHDEWQRAVYALIKDELFFQEAEREHNTFINMIVDRYLRGGDIRPRSQIASEIRRLMAQDMDRHFRLLNAEMVKVSGGMVKLHKVLEGRGLPFAEWQNRLKKKAFTQSYLHQILKPRAPDPGPRQIQRYYQDHPDEFTRPGVVRFRHIFFSNDVRGEERARDDAVDVWEQLVDGEIDFDAAAAAYSDDTESKNRGGLETQEEADDPEREAWLADIRAALREEPPGEIGPILESPFGCHIAMLVSIGHEQKIPFADVRRDIERKLAGAVWEEETDRYFTAIKRGVDIKVLQPSFPPHLGCAVQAGQSAGGPRVYHMTTPDITAPRSRRGGTR